MILTRLLDHLAANKVATPGQIARALDSAPEAIRSMLGTLERRGLVHRVRPFSGCGSACRQCAQADSELYAYGPERNAPPDCPTDQR